MQHDLRVFAMLAQIEAPNPLMHHEHFRSLVAVLRIHASRRLPRSADIVAMRLGNMDELFRIFRHARSNNREIFLGFRSGGACVDERVETGL